MYSNTNQTKSHEGKRKKEKRESHILVDERQRNTH